MQVAVLVVTAVIAGVRHPQARFRLEHVTHDLSLCNTNKPECISVGYVASAESPFAEGCLSRELVCPGDVPIGGICLRKVSVQGGHPSGVYTPRPEADPPVEKLTDAYENITFP